jgi:sugar phosphate isomerase/epimerase
MAPASLPPISSLQFPGVAVPGVTISGIFPEAWMMPGYTLQGLRQLEKFPFFESVHLLDVSDPAERAEIARWLRDHNVALTYCLTIIMYREDLDLSAADESARRKAVARLVEGMREATECGAVCAQLISGPGPANLAERSEKLARLELSLAEIAREAGRFTSVPLAIEPLDVRFHKRRALGYTDEAIRLTQAMRRIQPNFTLCLDSAHMILNDEDPAAMIEQAQGLYDELHLCNCITVPGHEFYGDYHPPFGAPGRLDAAAAGRILAAAVRTGFLDQRKRGRVTGEILRRKETPQATLQHVQDFLLAAWDSAQRELTTS